MTTMVAMTKGVNNESDDDNDDDNDQSGKRK